MVGFEPTRSMRTSSDAVGRRDTPFASSQLLATSQEPLASTFHEMVGLDGSKLASRPVGCIAELPKWPQLLGVLWSSLFVPEITWCCVSRSKRGGPLAARSVSVSCPIVESPVAVWKPPEGSDSD